MLLNLLLGLLHLLHLLLLELDDGRIVIEVLVLAHMILLAQHASQTPLFLISFVHNVHKIGLLVLRIDLLVNVLS